jgi:uracil-DNA glycosylase family 4
MTQRDEKRQAMDQVAADIAICRKCPLWQNTHYAVPGEGNLEAALFFIGEAPGEQEDLTGRPFVGRAGILLTALLKDIGLSREEVFIGNVVKHRPPGNRDPHGDEIAICSPYLDRQLQVIRPRIIVPLGRHSARYILGKAGIEFGKITDIRGMNISTDLQGMTVSIIPTLHPAAALYSPRYREDLQEDFRLIQWQLQHFPMQGTD